MWFKLRTLGDNHEQSLDTCCLSLTCISIIWPLVGTASIANFWHFVQVCMSLAQSLQYRIFAWTFQKDWSSDGGFLAPSKTLQAKNTTLSARRKDSETRVANGSWSVWAIWVFCVSTRITFGCAHWSCWSPEALLSQTSEPVIYRAFHDSACSTK